MEKIINKILKNKIIAKIVLLIYTIYFIIFQSWRKADKIIFISLPPKGFGIIKYIPIFLIKEKYWDEMCGGKGTAQCVGYFIMASMSINSIDWCILYHEFGHLVQIHVQKYSTVFNHTNQNRDWQIEAEADIIGAWLNSQANGLEFKAALKAIHESLRNLRRNTCIAGTKEINRRLEAIISMGCVKNYNPAEELEVYDVVEEHLYNHRMGHILTEDAHDFWFDIPE